MTALDKADRGQLSLDAPITLTREDLTLFHQPVARADRRQRLYHHRLHPDDRGRSSRATIPATTRCCAAPAGPKRCAPSCATRAIERDPLRPGRAAAAERDRRHGVEAELCRSIAASRRRARAVPAGVRRAAFERYIANPMDGATPRGIVEALARLKRGELLSPASTQKLLSIMANTRTGPQRLKGGLAARLAALAQDRHRPGASAESRPAITISASSPRPTAIPMPSR